jgi:hypothetical protein
MKSRAKSLIVASLITAALASGCKLDGLVFSADRVDAYNFKSTIIPDSLRREVQFPSGGETLHAMWIRQAGSGPRFTIVYSHGKGTNLADDTPREHAEAMWQAGFDILVYDYRGFGRSTGTSKDETTLDADAQAALAFALSQAGVTLDKVISYGHSLGSAPAIALAAATPGLRALVVESGFANGQAMAESADPLGIPVAWLLREPMLNTQRIATVKSAVLVIHGGDDALIPTEQGVALYNAANDPKQLRLVAGATHTDIPKVMGAGYGTLLRTFIAYAAP